MAVIDRAYVWGHATEADLTGPWARRYLKGAGLAPPEPTT